MKTNTQNDPAGGNAPAQPAASRRAEDPRQSMAHLPRALQPLITALTGKALPGEEPLIEWTGAGRFWQVLLGTLLGIAGSALLWNAGGWALTLLPVSWLLTVWGLRSIQTTLIHHGAHNTLFRSEALTARVGELLSTLIWILPFEAYKAGHVHHHAATATLRDIDLLFLKLLGFRPGLAVAEYWRQLRRMIVGPKFHGQYLAERLRANFVDASAGRRALAVGWTLVAAALTVWAPGTMLVAFLLPAIPFYQAAGLLQLLTEHSWVRVGERVNTVKQILSRVTTGRFMGVAVPDVVVRGGNSLQLWIALAGWTVEMLLVHLPARLFVVQGDLPNHDFHHRKPGSDGWTNASYVRRDDAEATPSGWLPYDEVWGLKAALHLTFNRLSQLPADADLGDPLTYGEVADIRLTM